MHYFKGHLFTVNKPSVVQTTNWYCIALVAFECINRELSSNTGTVLFPREVYNILNT